MTDLFFKRQAITGAIESIIADLEIRQQAIKGDSQAVKVLSKESRKEKKEILTRHCKNLNHIHKFIHEQFELITKLNKSNN
tara:strand:- start:183 stop:425 length:243 start_codon:yes stop_codon:yes gene_type:complete